MGVAARPLGSRLALQLGGTPVRKGGPGHLVIWAERGVTELRWSVPGCRGRVRRRRHRCTRCWP